MSKGKDQHIVPHSEGWAVKSEGASKATKIFHTQQEAIEKGREIAIPTNQHFRLCLKVLKFPGFQQKKIAS
ncbi:MAG: DUF2188 domain-containing protein [Nostoc sp.]|uniref:DUF2188 domain-containing protein n=1 Tax=Nostoc sp. TaxID=1180 RepID=UPI002FF524C7